MVSLHQFVSLILVVALISAKYSYQLGNKPTNHLAADHSKPLSGNQRVNNRSAKGPRETARFLVSLNPKNKQAIEDLRTKLDHLGIKHKILLDITDVPEVFYGVSIQLDDKTQAKLLIGINGVQDVKQVGLITRGPTYGGKIISKPLTTTVDKFPPHLQTNITMLHNQRIFGAGIKVALIDSGIDCTHPAFGGGFGKGKRIAFGRSYVDNDDKQSQLNHGPISNPCSDCARHGTHTAGIVGAADVGYGFQGVAPNVTLGMYPFGCNPDATDDMIIKALTQAHIDGADIISLSFGSAGGWSGGKEILDAVNKLVELKGAIIIAAAGNEGTNGLFSASSPASARASIAVGSVDSSSPMARSFSASTGKSLTYYKNQVLPDGSYPVYFTSNNLANEDDACSALPSSTPNLSKYVVMIKIGSCFIAEKVLHARARGAKLIFFYMKSRIIVSMHSEVLGVTVAGVSLEDAEIIAAQAKQNPNRFRLVFNTSGLRTIALQPGLESPFSQFGPSFDFESPQPAISGIGGNVVSTYPMVDGGFSSLSGTSMSTPQIAGIAALILSHRGKKGFNGYTMRDRLTTSSRIINYSAFLHKPHTVVHQGGGLINAYCAVMANTIIPNATLALSDSVSFKELQHFTIINTGKTAVKYNITHLPAVSVKTFAAREKFDRPDVTPDQDGRVATAVITPVTFTLAPGAEKTVKVAFRAPKAESAELMVYSGYLILNGNVECESHNVPYYGVVGSLKEQEVIDRGPTSATDVNFPYLAFRNDAAQLDGSPSYSVQGPHFIWKLRENGELYIFYRTVFGSPVFRLDVIAGDANPSPSKTRVHTFQESFGGAKIFGMIPGTQFKSMARSPVGSVTSTKWDASIITDARHLNPIILKNGTYKLLMRALRVNGRLNMETDFDFWVSPAFQLIT
ncbi:hypothetical protein PCASD_13329 [Puccinia coronata f. sp. avenae]|uniref:Peptidase S8/S53 domain-containing protein n=1 Tax=Puccinia coronata f. sp. avenae TaxID=200324 RepID=A0A2N5SUP2_9BASI|nr:hypothetical protein PCASD_13329 [Puccinia coronata f. sp. avenae]